MMADGLKERDDLRLAFTPHQLALVRSSFEAAQGVMAVAPELFFERLFYFAPSLRRLFPEDLREPKRRFVPMLASLVDALDHPAVLVPLLKHVAERLAANGISSAHYKHVCEALLWTLERVLAGSFNPGVEAAWRVTLRELTDVLAKSKPSSVGNIALAATSAEERISL
jgi:nitric oxide dioxygenase